MSRQKTDSRPNQSDFYPTPMWCYENLDIDWSQFTSAHEPCRGDGRIQRWLQQHGVKTTYSEIREGKNFFSWNGKVDLILTNPPFSLSQEFIDHSIERANTIIMLLRVNFLGSVSRYDWWKENSPTCMYVLSKRPSFTGIGTDATEYAWFVWDKTDRLPKGVRFVPPPTKEQVALTKKFAQEASKDILTTFTLWDINN